MFFQQAETRDVLDAITHIYSAWTDRARVRERFVQDAYALHQAAAAWRNFVRRVLAEEHTTYEVDDECNVRYAIDEAYALNRKATLSGLQDPRWDASRAEFERAFAAMDGTVQDTNGSVRAMAAAVESCAKVMIGNGIARVGPAEIERYLWPMVGELYQNDQVAADASHQILKSLADWVNATHQYRHGQDAGTEVRVPLELAIQFLTLGAGFLRWLIDMDVHRAARS